MNLSPTILGQIFLRFREESAPFLLLNLLNNCVGKGVVIRTRHSSVNVGIKDKYAL